MTTEIYMGEDTEDAELRSTWLYLHASCADLERVVVVLKMTFETQTEHDRYRAFAQYGYPNNIKLESRRNGVKSNDILGGEQVVTQVTYKDTPTEIVRAYMFTPQWNRLTISAGTRYGTTASMQLFVVNVNYLRSAKFEGEVQLSDGSIKDNTITETIGGGYIYFEMVSGSATRCKWKTYNVQINCSSNAILLGMFTAIALGREGSTFTSSEKSVNILDKTTVVNLLNNKYISTAFTHDGEGTYIIDRLDDYLASYEKWILNIYARFGMGPYYGYNRALLHSVKAEVEWALDSRVVVEGTPPNWYNIYTATDLNIKVQVIIKHDNPRPILPFYASLAKSYKWDEYGHYYIGHVPASGVEFKVSSTNERVKIGVGWMDAYVYTATDLVASSWSDTQPITTHMDSLYIYIRGAGNYMDIEPIEICTDANFFQYSNKLQPIKEICGTLDRPILARFMYNENANVTYINNADHNRLNAQRFETDSVLGTLTPDLRDIVGKDIWDTKKVSLFCLYGQEEGQYPQGEVLDVYVAGRAILPPPEYMAENCKANALVNSDVAVIPQMLAVKNATYCLPIINGHNILYKYNGVTNDYHISTPIKPTGAPYDMMPMPYVCTLVNFDYNAIRNYAFLSNQQTQTPKKITLQTEAPDIAEVIFTLPAEEGVFVATNDNIHTQLYMECIDNYFDRQQTALSRKYNLGIYYKPVASNDIESIKVVHKVTLRLKDLDNTSVWYYQWLFTNVEVVAMRVIYKDNANIIAPSAEITEYSAITPMPHFRYNVAKVVANNAIANESNGEFIVYLERVVANLN